MIATWAPGVVAILIAAVVLLVPGRSTSGGTIGSPSQGDKSDGCVEIVGRDVSNSSGQDRGSGRRTWLRWRRSARTEVLSRSAPGAQAVGSALALLAIAFRSGLPTWQVLDAVAEQSPDAVAADLRQVSAALRWGAHEQEAWASVDPAWAPAARAVSIAHRAGVAPAALLMKAADDTRRDDLERLELAAAQVGVRLVLPLGLVLLPAFCLTTVVPLVISLGRRLLTSG